MTREIDHFGGCPVCGMNNGYINVGSAHYFVCRRHRVKWRAGANLFSDWKDETETERRKAAEVLRQFREVKPIYGCLELLAARVRLRWLFAAFRNIKRRWLRVMYARRQEEVPW